MPLSSLYSQPRVPDGLVLVAGEAHGEGISGSSCDWLNIMSVLHAAGEGRDSSFSWFYGSVGLGMFINEDEPPSSEVSLVIGQVEKTGKMK